MPGGKVANSELAMQTIAFQQWMMASRDRPDEDRSYALKMMGEAVKEELSPIQQTYILAYLVDGHTMQEIGDIYGVSKSSVSRTVNRGIEKLRRVLKYTNPKLLSATIQGKKLKTGKKQRLRRTF